MHTCVFGAVLADKLLSCLSFLLLTLILEQEVVLITCLVQATQLPALDPVSN